MTINLSDNTPRVSYTVAQGVTQTSFTVSFEFFAEADLNVYVDGTLKTLTTDYSVSGGSGATGSITMSVTGATGGSTVVITRDIALERTTDFPAAGAFQIASLNTELDKITAQFADRKDDVDRSLRLKDQDAAVSMELPLKATRLGTVLGFNATTGAPEAGPTIANVNSLADITTNINTVAGISSNVTTVAGISANVTTVAGISSNVSTVAGISSNVTSVAGNATNINTVATNISNINSVAAKSSLITSDFVSDLNTLAVTDVINDINTLATSDIVSDLNTLATSDIVSDLNTLATSDIVSDINTLATSDIVTDLNLLATSDFVSDLNTMATTTNVNNLATVAGAVSNVNTVAGISSDVTAVAGISSDVAAVEDIAANVTSVAGNASNINAAVSNASNINAVVSNASNINSVAGIAANVTTVAGIASNVTTVAGAASNVSTVAGAITNVNNVGGSIANVNTVATNISGVNSFAERYRVGSSDPSSSLDAGDLAYNTSDNALKYYTGSAWASITAGIGNVVEDTSPQLGGALDVNGNSITSASNGDVTIDPNGTGDIVLDANVQIGTTTEGIADYGDTLTLADSDHCGMTIRSGTSSEGNVYFSDGTSGDAEYKGIVKYDHGSNAMSFWSNSLRRVTIDSSGNLLLGKTALGTANDGLQVKPAGELVVTRDGNHSLILNRKSSDGNIALFQKDGTTVGSIGALGGRMYAGTGDVGVFFDSTNNMITPYSIDAGDTVDNTIDLGYSSRRFKNVYSKGLDVDLGTNARGKFANNIGEVGSGNFAFMVVNSADTALKPLGLWAEDIRFATGSSERGRFDSSGNFLIGQSSQTVPGIGNNTVGHSIRPNGDIFSSCSAGEALYLNRSTNDGGILSIRRQGTQVGVISVTTSGTTYNTTSDIRLKQNIEPLVATDKLMAMNPVSYAWKSDPDGPRSMGFIAQEMQEVMPEAVSTGDDEDAMMSMDYGRITPILVSALQDAHRKIEQLEQRIADMENN